MGMTTVRRTPIVTTRSEVTSANVSKITTGTGFAAFVSRHFVILRSCCLFCAITSTLILRLVLRVIALLFLAAADDTCDKVGGCDQNAACNGVPSGGYRCQCNSGYLGDGYFCDGTIGVQK